MQIYAERRSDTLYFRLNGEIDEHNAAIARREADKVSDTHAPCCKRAVFDLANVSFMDSSGIGFLIGRYKKLRRYGVSMYVMNPTLSADRILEMSGVYSVIPKL